MNEVTRTQRRVILALFFASLPRSSEFFALAEPKTR